MSVAEHSGKVKNFAGLITAWLTVMLLLLTLWFEAMHIESSRLWTIYLATVVLVVLSLFTYYSIKYQSKRIDFFHPLFFALWFFYFPQIWFSAMYYSDENIALELPAIATLWDRNESFRFALIVALIGTISFGFGFIASIGAKLGQKFPRTALMNGSLELIKAPVQNLFLIGIASEIILFLGGAKIINTSGGLWQFSGVFQFLSWFFSIAAFVSWYAYFRKESGWGFIRFVFILTAVLELLTRGSRGTLFQTALLIFAAYQYANFNQSSTQFIKRLTFIWAPIVLLTLIVGFYFGSNLRSLIWQEDMGQTSVTQALTLSSEVFDKARQGGGISIIEEAWSNITVRSRTGLIALSVLLTYSETHRAEEVALGLDNKIVKDLVNVFIPRFLLPDRATIGSGRHIGAIFYGQPLNTPGQTMFGDLFREFGWAGLVVGMFVLGATYRSLYTWLIDQPQLTPLCAAVFYLVFDYANNFESQYSQFYPIIVRMVMFVALLLILLGMLNNIGKRFRS
jgi:hypothetical protein